MSENENPLSKAIMRKSGGGSGTEKEFLFGLFSRLVQMGERARLAKVVVQPALKEQEVKVYLVVRDGWKAPRGFVKLVDFYAYPADLVPIPGYASYTALGVERLVPVEAICGFQWCHEEQEQSYFNGLNQYKEPN